MTSVAKVLGNGEIRMGLERLNPLARHTNAVEGSMEVISQSHVA